MRTVKAITGFGAAEKFYKRLGGAIRYILPAATALAFISLSTDASAQTPSSDLLLDNLSINENQAIGTAIGNFSAVDADVENHTFALVPGIGDDDNASFTILANKLQAGVVFNFEVKASYSVRVAVTGDDGEVFEKPFTIAIGDINDKPTLTSVTRNVLHNQTYTFDVSDFEVAYSDEDGDMLMYVNIQTLPTHGKLMFYGYPSYVGDWYHFSELSELTYEAPDTIYGQVSFDWIVYDGNDISDDIGTTFINVNRGRITGTATNDITTVTLPPGVILVGHSGIRPPDAGIDPELGGGLTSGRRPSANSADPTAQKIGDETSVNTLETADLNVTAFPNPFANAAQIRFTLPEAAVVEVNIYNYMGALVKQVVNGVQPAGVNSISVGDELSNGSYIYKVKVQGKDGQPAIYRTGSIVKLK
ncbi:hypothetical protein BH09BAC1_BH09BAC1_02150 [soil metagenome]